jgi:hypothetical protein
VIDVPDLDEVGASTGNNEETEPKEDPPERNFLALPDKLDEENRDGGVGQGDERSDITWSQTSRGFQRKQ